MKESKIQKEIIDELEKNGYFVIKVIRANKRGIPDLIICSPNGNFYAIETKRKGKCGNTSPLQDYQMKMINEIGGIAFVADSLDTIKEKGLI